MAFKEFPIKNLLGGLCKDKSPQDVPPGTWSEHNQFHVFDGRIKKYGGWYAIPENGSSVAIDGEIIFGFEWVKEDQARRFIVGTLTSLYMVDLVSGLVTLIQTGYTAHNTRWFQAIINDRLMLVNGEDPIQEVASDVSTAAALVGDAALPNSATYILNNVNHLVVGRTVEAGVLLVQRVRWSDIDDPQTWVRTSVNEPGFLDIDRGEIRGMANLGQFGFMVYSDSDIYQYSYVGRPFVYSKNRIVTDIGLLAPYSLVAYEDKHFFLGTNGFYMFDGGSIPRRIGEGKIDTYFLSNFNPLYLDKIFGFAHPTFPEIWWVYKDLNADTFNRALVYNWETGVWAERNPFPQAMLAGGSLSTGLVWQDATFEWDSPEANVTWASLSQQGGSVLVGSGSTVGVGVFIASPSFEWIITVNDFGEIGVRRINFDVVLSTIVIASASFNWLITVNDAGELGTEQTVLLITGPLIISSASFSWLITVDNDGQMGAIKQ